MLGDLSSDHLLAGECLRVQNLFRAGWLVVRLLELVCSSAETGLVKLNLLLRQAMRCSPEERRPTVRKGSRGWRVPAAVLCWIGNRPWSMLGRSGGEGDERSLARENCDSQWSSWYQIPIPWASIGSSRRGDLLSGDVLSLVVAVVVMAMVVAVCAQWVLSRLCGLGQEAYQVLAAHGIAVVGDGKRSAG